MASKSKKSIKSEMNAVADQPEAQIALGRSYMEKLHVKGNLEKAIELFASAAKAGNEMALYKLGTAYAFWENEEKEKRANRKELTQQHNPGLGFAHFLRGMAHEDKGDIDTALEYYLKGAAQGSEDAQYAAGAYFYKYRYKDDNLKKAAEYLLLSANQGYTPANTLLGKLHKQLTGHMQFDLSLSYRSALLDNGNRPSPPVIDYSINPGITFADMYGFQAETKALGDFLGRRNQQSTAPPTAAPQP